MTDDDLLAKLPAAARDAFAKAIAARPTKPGDSLVHATAALVAAGVPPITPPFPVFPLASTFDDVQRAALEYSVVHNLAAWPCACPVTAETRRRWLGLDPPGVLESLHVDVEHDGTTTNEPLWRALQITARDVGRQAAILDTLPFVDALQAIVELQTVGFGYRIETSLFIPHGNLRLLRELRDEAREWAIATAERAVNSARPKNFGGLVVFALARAKVPIERRWEVLFPGGPGASKDFLIECLAALPEDRRVEVFGPRLAGTPWALDIVAAFPYAGFVRALLASREPNSDAWNYFVEKFRELGKAHPAVAAEVEAIVAATPKPIELFVTRSVKPTRASELSELEREQVRIGVRGYVGDDPDPDARLPDDLSEAAVGTLEIRNIADEAGTAQYDAFTYFADGGVIFRAGTTEELAWLSQGGVVLRDKNDALRVALQTALGPRAKRLKAKERGAAKKPAAAKKTRRK